MTQSFEINLIAGTKDAADKILKTLFEWAKDKDINGLDNVQTTWANWDGEFEKENFLDKHQKPLRQPK